MNLIKKAQQVFSEYHSMNTRFERALFLSWYCSKGDCDFCYMSTQKDLIKDPLKARRSAASIFAEAEIAYACGWDIEFLSGGYESFNIDEIVYMARRVAEITRKKQWLNIGTMKIDEMDKFIRYAQGYVGTLESVNPQIRKKTCPSKPMDKILDNYRYADELGLKKAVTVIIGLGEQLEDFVLLKEFISDNGISHITFYALNPQKGTPYTESPSIDYYEQWIAMTRIAYPYLHIVAGAWSDKVHYISRLLLAGANNFTKLPVMKIFGTDTAKEIEKECEKAGRKLKGTLTKIPEIKGNLAPDIREKVDEYLKKMSK